jgi:hypothetical protein
MHLLSPQTDVLTGETLLENVMEMYNWFQPINSSRIIWGKFMEQGMYAKRLIHACRWGGQC